MNTDKCPFGYTTEFLITIAGHDLWVAPEENIGEWRGYCGVVPPKGLHFTVHAPVSRHSDAARLPEEVVDFLDSYFTLTS